MICGFFPLRTAPGVSLLDPRCCLDAGGDLKTTSSLLLYGSTDDLSDPSAPVESCEGIAARSNQGLI